MVVVRRVGSYKALLPVLVNVNVPKRATSLVVSNGEKPCSKWRAAVGSYVTMIAAPTERGRIIHRMNNNVHNFFIACMVRKKGEEWQDV